MTKQEKTGKIKRRAEYTGKRILLQKTILEDLKFLQIFLITGYMVEKIESSQIS